jgi:16S rRNA (adenine1518-N6/adenine1519-N6)-dimethyltransferase
MKENITPKKSLGQHFIRDIKIINKIIAESEIKKDSIVIEIGPGEGIFTEELIKKSKKVISIEKDENLSRKLKEKFENHIKKGNFDVINADILEAELENLVSDDFILVGNIPYYITGAIFRKIFEGKKLPKSITFVVQKEVAERIVAKNKKESILSISIKAYGDVSLGSIIKAGSFFPKPKVDSAIIKIKNISRENFLNIDEKRFFDIVKAGFSHKRKILLKNIKDVLKIDQDKVLKVFEKIGLDKNSRAEDLDIKTWLKISTLL